MEYLIDLRFEDTGYNAIVHFVATFIAEDAAEARVFADELSAAFKRRGAIIYPSLYYPLDSDEAKERWHSYYDFSLGRATATLKVEQFVLENPDQNQSLIDNLTEQLFTGENSTATFGNKYDIPVRVLDKETRNPIEGEFFYYTIEHLIPKK